MTNLTSRERELLVLVVEMGVEANGAHSADELVSDNMTWFDLTDVAKAMKISDADFGKWAQSTGSVQASLSRKGLIADSGEPHQGRNRRYFAWYATEAGIRAVAGEVWGAEHPPVDVPAQDVDKEAARLERNRKARERRAAKKAQK